MHAISTYLATLHPLAPYLAISLLVGAIVWAWRSLHPRSFERLPTSLQGLPAVLLGAVIAAWASGGDVDHAMVEALLGALAGLTAIGGHHVAKASPLPYGSKKGTP